MKMVQFCLRRTAITRHVSLETILFLIKLLTKELCFEIRISPLKIVCFLLTISSTYGVNIKCSFIIATSSVGDRYTCEVTEITYENPSIVEDIRGHHLSGKTNEDVEAFRYSFGRVLHSIPKNIDKFFPHLVVFEWSESDLKTITAEDLKPWSNLQVLYIAGNELVSLDGCLFIHSQKLQRVYLHRNEIIHVGHDLFTGLDELTHVNFESNRCVSISAQTSEAVQDLNFELPIDCPILNHHRTDKCLINPKEEELNNRVEDQRILICDHEDRICELEEIIKDLEERLGRIEKIEKITEELMLPVKKIK